MKIQWNTVTWYSTALAIVLYVATFCVGVTLGLYWQTETNPAEPIATDTHYVNKEFGLEFDVLLPEYPVKQTGDVLTSGLSGSIERFSIKEGQNIHDAMAELIYADLNIVRYSENDVFDDECIVVPEPWIPHEYLSDTFAGSILYHVYYRELEAYYNSVEQRYKQLFGDNYYQLEVGGEVAGYVRSRCSRFASVYSQPSGFFLYNPVNAPNRFYFVDTSNHGGEALFYQTSSIRVLPD